MWEDEFYEFAGSVSGGKLTPIEQKQEWTRLLSEELVPKDNGGPREAGRCLVVIGNYIIDYDDVCKEDQDHMGPGSLAKMSKVFQAQGT